MLKGLSEEIVHSIEYLIMTLSNITIVEEGQKHVLGEGRLRGAIIESLFGMSSYFIKSGVFDFVSNILSNFSSMKEGRKYMIENKMIPKILEMLRGDLINDHRRRHLIEVIRNMAFEYEQHEKTFLNVRF